MKKLKLILPMMAFIFAIALSFATVKLDESVISGYYGPPGNRQLIEVGCQGEGYECKIQFVDSNNNPVGSEILVYPDQTSLSPLQSSSDSPELIEL